jgi:hypothetical protein
VTHRAGRVERLGHRDERDARGVEDRDDAGEVGQRPGQAVDLVDHDDVDLPRRDIREQRLESWALHRAAGEAAIVEDGRKRDPTLLLLAQDVGGAGLALGAESRRCCGLCLTWFRLRLAR